jgi:DNA-binding CsgD family transcriptional regulator
MLTPRQHEVLLLLADGHSTTQLADALSISQETVRNHVKRVLRTMGARSRLEAVVRAHELNMV